MNDEQRKWIYYAIPVVVVIGLGAALYYGRTHRQSAEQPVAAAPPAPVNETPQIRHPIEEEPAEEKPLPPLNESDKDVQDSLGGLFGRTLDPFLVPKDIVRNVVVTIDNLPREKTAIQQRPIRSTPGEFLVGGTDDAPVLATENYARYTPFVTAVGTLDAKTLVSFYRGLQPLFQQSYEELGNPNSLFNTRMLEVIEHLLATPDVRGPIRLTRPGVFYRYADQNLEELSAGQKLLIRMGPDNAAIIKEKLREIQSELL
jgi:Protein of unknown function (DUF3014)